MADDTLAPLLQEIRDALLRLVEEGEELTIELDEWGLDETALRRLEELLGKGEVEARIEAGGSRRACESGYAGVWWVELAGGEGEGVWMRLIEVAPVPNLLKSDEEDIRDALARLDDTIGEGG